MTADFHPTRKKNWGKDKKLLKRRRRTSFLFGGEQQEELVSLWRKAFLIASLSEQHKAGTRRGAGWKRIVTLIDISLFLAFLLLLKVMQTMGWVRGYPYGSGGTLSSTLYAEIQSKGP